MNRGWHLFLDQNLRYEIRDRLLKERIDAVHAADVQMQRALDPDILQYAIDQDRTLVTLDTEFGNLNLFPLPKNYPVSFGFELILLLRHLSLES